jgi:hypothetical protein
VSNRFCAFGSFNEIVALGLLNASLFNLGCLEIMAGFDLAYPKVGEDKLKELAGAKDELLKK